MRLRFFRAVFVFRIAFAIVHVLTGFIIDDIVRKLHCTGFAGWLAVDENLIVAELDKRRFFLRYRNSC